MSKLRIALVSLFLLTPVAIFAENEISETLFNQLKANITKSCENQDYLNCIESDSSVCNKVVQTELEKISQIFDTQAQAIAEGKISELLLEIKQARSKILEENNIDISKANSCGKQHLSD